MILERIGSDRFLMLDDRLAGWIAHRIPGMNADDLRRHAATVGVVLKGDLIAAMACGGKERGNVEITFAADSPKWATRDTIRTLMAWPFVQMGCHRVTTRIAASNTRAIRFNEGIGFKREGVIRQGWGPGEDCVLLGLLRGEAPEWMVPHGILAATPEIA
jgi:hypothetical protein